MKKKAKVRRGSGTDDLRKEYRFDYRRAKPNRFAPRFQEGSIAVVLEPDVASVFRTSESVNVLLRSVLAAIPKTVRKKGSGSNNALQRTGAGGKRSVRR
jgi:hypothetical protein